MIAKLKTLIQIHKSLLLLFGILMIFAAFQFIAVRKHTQSWYFPDETEHVTLAWMMDSFDAQLYKDLSTNHQPLPILISFIFLQLISFNTLFELIEGLRLSMFCFSLAWGIYLTYRFRLVGLLSYIFIQATAYQFLGFHVLAESLAVYSLTTLILYATLFFEKNKTSDTISTADLLVISFSFVWSVFTLLPLIPFLGILGLWLLYNVPKNQRLFLIGSMLLMTGLLALVINPFLWYEETIYNNIHYFFPAAGESRTVPGILFSLSTFLPSTDYLFETMLLFAGMLLIVLLKYRKKRFYSLCLLILAILPFLFLNWRVEDKPENFYQAFHYYPFIASILTITALSIGKFSSSLKLIPKAVFVTLISILVVCNVNSWWFEKKDKLTDYYIQYNRYEDFARIIKTVQQPGETLFTGPDGHGYINILANVSLAGRQNFHLQWSWLSPKLKDEFYVLFATKPPTYIYFQADGSGYARALDSILSEMYTQLYTKDDKETHFYIRNEKITSLSSEQRIKLEEIHLVKFLSESSYE